MKPTKKELLALHERWLKEGKLTFHSGLCLELGNRYGVMERDKFVEIMGPGSSVDDITWWGAESLSDKYEVYTKLRQNLLLLYANYLG